MLWKTMEVPSTVWKGEVRTVVAEDSGPRWQGMCVKIKELTVPWWAVLSYGNSAFDKAKYDSSCGSLD